MKITPVGSNITNYKINNYKINTPKVATFENKNSISFNGLEKLRLKMQGSKLQKEAKRNLKQADKVTIEASKIQDRGETLLLKAQIYQELAAEVLKEILPAINVSRGFGSKINFTDLEDGILSKTSKPLLDGGVQISEVRIDGTSRQIFVRNGKIFVNECDETGEVKLLYIFNLFTHELNAFAKNFKGIPGYSMYDEKYSFENGNIVSFDENLLKNKEETYEKSLTRINFKDGEIIECVQHLENIAGLKGSLGRVFCFSDGKLYEYDEDVTKDFYTDLTSSKKRFTFEEDGSLSFCLINDKDLDETWSKFKKVFEYKNRTIEKIDLNVVDNNAAMTSKKTFYFQNGKLAYCNLKENTSTKFDTTFDRQIVF